MKINPQISIDLTKAGIQIFQLLDTDTVWLPVAYLNSQNVPTFNPADATCALWIDDANSQPVYLGQSAGAMRSLGGSRIKQLLVQVLIPGVNVNRGQPGDNQLVLGCGKCVRASFADSVGTRGPLYT